MKMVWPDVIEEEFAIGVADVAHKKLIEFLKSKGLLNPVITGVLIRKENGIGRQDIVFSFESADIGSFVDAKERMGWLSPKKYCEKYSRYRTKEIAIALGIKII